MEACCKSNFWGFSFVVVCLFVCLFVFCVDSPLLNASQLFSPPLEVHIL